MSKVSQTDVRCPKCGHAQSVTVWESLNADVSPAAREDLLAGRINAFRCEQCNSRVVLSVPLLYHDMGRRFMAKYHPFEALDDPAFFHEYDALGESAAAALVSRQRPDLYKEYMGRVHVVFQMSELIRYVVFRERLHAHHQGGGGSAAPAAAPDR